MGLEQREGQGVACPVACKFPEGKDLFILYFDVPKARGHAWVTVGTKGT